MTAPLIGETGYMRRELDQYDTPEWVTMALLQCWRPARGRVWEPCAGKGNILEVLERELWARAEVGEDCVVLGSDIAPRHMDVDEQDFLSDLWMPTDGPLSIITNPPFEHADEVIVRALGYVDRVRTWGHHASVALLLPTDFDHASGRGDRRAAFFDRPDYAGQVKLRRRIRWIEGSTEAPRKNHLWHIWDSRHGGPPVVRYAR